MVIAMTSDAMSADPQMQRDIDVARLTRKKFQYPQSRDVAGDFRTGIKDITRI